MRRSRPATWEATVDATAIGDYRLRLVQDSPDATARSAEARFTATLDGTEYRGARRNDAMLAHLARATAGSVHRPGDWNQLADALATRQRGALLLQRHDLWDMPAVFLLLCALVIGEWALRRRVNLV